MFCADPADDGMEWATQTPRLRMCGHLVNASPAKDQRWIAWLLVVSAVGTFGIAVRAWNRDRGDAFILALLGLAACGLGVWTFWSGRSK
jgi:hypothetical protein